MSTKNILKQRQIARSKCLVYYNGAIQVLLNKPFNACQGLYGNLTIVGTTVFRSEKEEMSAVHELYKKLFNIFFQEFITHEELDIFMKIINEYNVHDALAII